MPLWHFLLNLTRPLRNALGLRSEAVASNPREVVTEIEDVAAAPILTVLIDTFNYGRFIEKAIESVLSQDFPEEQFEIIVVDDGSTDQTAQRVEKYGSRIQYFLKPNGGQASALNFGIEKARGEIVALLDADDFWLPGKLKRIADEFGKRPEAGMVYHRLLELNSETSEQKEGEFRALSGFLPDKPGELFWYVPYPTSCLAFRRKFLQQLLPIPEALRVQADGYLGVCIVFLAPILAIPECLAVYRIHGQNLYYDEEAAISPARRRQRIRAAKFSSMEFSRGSPPTATICLVRRPERFSRAGACIKTASDSF